MDMEDMEMLVSDR